MKTNGNTLPSKKNSDLLKLFQDEYDNKLMGLKEKIINSLCKKYSKLYLEKNYTKSNLESDLGLILQNIDFNSFNYDYFIKELEKAIIDKLNSGTFFTINTLRELKNCVSPTVINRKIPLSKSSNDINLKLLKEKPTSLRKKKEVKMNSSMVLKEKVAEDVKEVNKLNDNKIEVVDCDGMDLNNYNQTSKMKLLKNKADSEWNIIVKLDSIIADDEKIKRQNKKLQERIKIRENLHHQMEEAKDKKTKNCDEERMMEMKIDLMNKKKDLEIENKQLEMKMKILKEKELRDKFLSETIEKKKKEKELEMKKDLDFLEHMKKEMFEDEEKKKKKKSIAKETMLKIIDENNKNIQYLKENKEKLRQEKKTHFEEYRNILEQQAIEREEKLKKMKDKIKETVEKKGDLTSLKNVILKNIIEDKIYEKDKVFKEKVMDEEQVKKSLKVKKLKEDFLKINDNMLKEKQMKKEKEKETENVILNQMGKSIELLRKESDEKAKLYKHKNIKYQEELQKQINERTISNPFRMNEIEKKINMEFIDEYRKHEKE